jgi:hypothetical protein
MAKKDEGNIPEIDVQVRSFEVTAHTRKLKTKWSVGISPWMVCGMGTDIYWEMCSIPERKTILIQMGYSEKETNKYCKMGFDDFSEDMQQDITDFTDDARWHEYNTKTGERRKTHKRMF